MIYNFIITSTIWFPVEHTNQLSIILLSSAPSKRLAVEHHIPISCLSVSLFCFCFCFFVFFFVFLPLYVSVPLSYCLCLSLSCSLCLSLSLSLSLSLTYSLCLSLTLSLSLYLFLVSSLGLFSFREFFSHHSIFWRESSLVTARCLVKFVDESWFFYSFVVDWAFLGETRSVACCFARCQCMSILVSHPP